jgi:hypothetical protein
MGRCKEKDRGTDHRVGTRHGPFPRVKLPPTIPPSPKLLLLDDSSSTSAASGEYTLPGSIHHIDEMQTCLSVLATLFPFLTHPRH